MRHLMLGLALVLGGCATATLNTTDSRRAVVLAPYQRAIPPFATLNVPEGTVLYAGAVNGEPAWCAAGPIYWAPGEGRPVCFFAPGGTTAVEGWLKSAYIVNTASAFRYEVDVPFRVVGQMNLPPR